MSPWASWRQGDASGDDRSQIIARVYAELYAVQQQYGPEVKYEVTGLYDGLKVMPLSDVEYYIYLEPVIAVSKF